MQSINGPWDHDLFSGAGQRRSGGGLGNGLAGAQGGSAKLVISNLDFGVNDQDIRVIFNNKS